MANVAKKIDLSNEARLLIAHKAMAPKNYHVDSVESRPGLLIADVVNEADPADEYHPKYLTIAELIFFIRIGGLNYETIDSVDNNGEPVSELFEVADEYEYLAQNAKAIIKQYLDAGKDIKTC